LFCISFLFNTEDNKAISGILIGIGAGLFGMSISNLLMKRFEDKNPGIKKLQEIEQNDERRIIISNKSKAKSADITRWLIIVIAYIMILINAPLWATLFTVLVFAAYHILCFYYAFKYEKIM